MIKTAVIPAAGKGTRMLNVAANKPKHLIKIKEHPFLYYVLSNLKAAGIEKMILVVGHKKEQMEEFAKEHADKFDITLVDQFETAGTERYGTAIPIQCVRDIVGNEGFVSLFGDNLYSPDDIRAIAVDDDFCYTSVMEHEHPEKYGVIVPEGEHLAELVEKPKTFISNLISTGLHKFTPEVFDAVDRVEKSARGEYELTDAIKSLARERKVKIKRISDYWLDFGNPGDIIKMWHFVNKHNLK